jgi:dolichyl-phosphate-mannose-protein mannosyltransferase
MLVGLAGYLNHYNGTFEFGSAAEYPDWVDYVGMRMFLATFGALAVPLAFLTALAMDLSPTASILVGLMMLLDNGLIGISRLILLDSMLLFFTVSATLGLALFNRYRNE